MTAQYKLTVEFEGTQFFYTTEGEGVEYEHKNEKGEYHRLDGPAFVTKDGCEFWYVDGKKHREDGPASIYKNGSWGQTMMTWYKDGKIHREDGPAYIIVSLNEELTEVYGIGYEWYLEGERHRVDGPAFEVGGEKRWFVNGKLHREDGPAIEKQYKKKWYKHGVLHREDGPAYEFDDGVKKVNKWYREGGLHREDGPAYELENNDAEENLELDFIHFQQEPVKKKYEYWVNGKKHRDGNQPAVYASYTHERENYEYWVNGEMHREDGPAIFDTFTLNADTYQYWVKGKLHREDGPAFEMYRDDGERTEWWFNGVKHREDGPAYQSYTDDLEISEWWANGKLHRDGNQPAVCKSYMNGEVYREVYEWWVNGKRHREYGPALIVNEQEEFYLEDVEYTREQFFLLIEERNEEVKNALLENTNICKDVCGIIADYVWSLD